MLASMFSTPKQTGRVDASTTGIDAGVVFERALSNELVSPETALTVPAVLAAFTILSEDISSLPLILYRRLERGKERAFDNPYYQLLHDAPNPEHTSMIFRELMMGHLLGWGNFYAQLIWNNRGVITEMWPLRPDRMLVARKNGERVYLYETNDGKKRAFSKDEIWHVPAFGFDGLVGYSRIALMRNAIGLSMATERFGSRFFSNDARPSIALKYPKMLSATAQENILKSWNAAYSGAGRSHGTAILEEGLDIKEIGIPPEDAQFLETRAFQLGEIARAFRVPPHLIGDVEKSTSWGSGIEQQELGYLNHTLRPWMVRIEQTIGQQILLPQDRKNYFAEHLTEAMLRTDINTRMSAYVQAINNGIMNPNEVRERENLNPYEGGDDYRMPLNMSAVTGEDEPVEDPEDESEDEAPAEEQDPTVERLRPFILDAVQRSVRREIHEIEDALKRCKGDLKRFEDWLDEFYTADHFQYFGKTMAPLNQDVSNAVRNYCDFHKKRLRLALEDGKDINALFDYWRDELPQAFTQSLIDEVIL
jgi:HK97 family phage portal protein